MGSASLQSVGMHTNYLAVRFAARRTWNTQWLLPDSSAALESSLPPEYARGLHTPYASKSSSSAVTLWKLVGGTGDDAGEPCCTMGECVAVTVPCGVNDVTCVHLPIRKNHGLLSATVRVQQSARPKFELGLGVSTASPYPYLGALCVEGSQQRAPDR